MSDPWSGTSQRPTLGLAGWTGIAALAVSIYGQRIIIPGVEVGLGAVFLPITGLIIFVTQRGLVSSPRAMFAAAFVLCGTTSLILATSSSVSSVGSFALLLLLWAPFLLQVPARRASAQRVLESFPTLCLPPAVVALAQFVAPAAMSSVDPFATFPAAWVNTSYQFYNAFSYDAGLRSNGLVFLEPSFASQYFALACLIALRGSRRWMLAILVPALVSTGSGSGMLVLGAGIAMFALSGKGRNAVLSLVLVAGGFTAISVFGIADAVLPRINEFAVAGTSGNIRFMAPFQAMGAALADSAEAIFVGMGPGAADGVAAQMDMRVNFSLIPKALIEYGALGGLLLIAGIASLVIRLQLRAEVRVAIALIIFLMSGALIQAHTSLLLWGLYVGTSTSPTTPALGLVPSSRTSGRGVFARHGAPRTP